MIQRAHGVESVSSMPRPGLDGGLCRWHLGVGVADAHAHLALRRFGDDFHRAGNFWSNRQHAHVAARSLPKTLEDGDGGRDQILGGMHSPALVAEKRAFEMNA